MEASSLSSFTQNIIAFSPHTPFSDQSHAQFYGCKAFSPSSKLAPSLLPLDPLRPKRDMVSLQAVLSNTSMQCEPAIEQNLMKELADLKLQMKQKKKELKAQMEEKNSKKKKSMKAEEEEKKKKKKKKGCSSESSSSSESSDGECESVLSMGLVTGQTGINGTDLHKQADLEKVDDVARSALRVPAAAGQASAESARAPAGAHKIEVCMGGKCKRAGSEQLLLALRGQIPDASSVDALPCKCMGKCAMGINVRVQKEDTNPQHHSHVSVKDAGLILSHHFGLGRPPTGLPSLGQEASTLPQHPVLV